MINPRERGKGAKKEKFKLKHLLRRRLRKTFGSAPINYLNIAKMFPVKDQGTSESCGGQAWSSALEVAKYLRDNTIVPLSAKDIYSHCYIQGGGSDEGTLLNFVENYGADTEADVPSYPDKLTPPIETPVSEPFMETVAPRNENTAFQQIVFNPLTFNGNDIKQVKLAIDTGVTVCALLGNNACWQTADGVVEVPSLDQLDWGHWVFCTDYFTISDDDDAAVKAGQMTMTEAKQRYLQGLSK